MEFWWIIVIILCVIIVVSALLATANYAVEKFLAVHEEMSKLQANGHKSILEFIAEVNHEQLGGKLKIAKTDKFVGDGYSSKSKTLILTDETLKNDTIASFAITAHELGHALQDAQGNLLKHKIRLKKAGWFFGKLFVPCLIVCVVLLFFPQYLTLAITFGGISAGIFLLAVILKSLTLYIEKDASKKAIVLLDEFLPKSDMKLVKKYLKSAKLTYLSDLLKLFFSWSGLTRKTKMFK